MLTELKKRQSAEQKTLSLIEEIEKEIKALREKQSVLKMNVVTTHLRYSSQIDQIVSDLNIDFGWYYFLTKPFFYILDFLYGLIGNMGWAILLFAALLRLMMFPIANKSYESMSKMKKIQPINIQEITYKVLQKKVLEFIILMLDYGI